MTLLLSGHTFDYELECLVRLFYPGERITVTHDPGKNDGEMICASVCREGGSVLLEALVRTGGETLSARESLDPQNAGEWESCRRLSALLFGLLCRRLAVRPPWGILTGVRPVRLCRKLLAKHGDLRGVKRALMDDYLVLPQKAELATGVLAAQSDILALDTPKSYSLYVSIPFCPTRCLYCSFVSHAVDKAARLLPEYLRLLCRELSEIGKTAERLGLSLRTVYIGGGTPTTLGPEQLRILLTELEKSFPISGASEYTVEAGRPDSITREKLEVLRDFGASRICVNPQALDDDVLRSIGRAHTSEQAISSVNLAREMGFDNINMDLIAGLPGQTPESFADSLECVIGLGAQNITLHTLTVKRSSSLRAEKGPEAYESGPFELSAILERAQRRLAGAGYRPYYLYRQQGTRQNHENTGFSLPGSEGVYNILSMEDAHTILGAGAGAVTKLVRPPDKMRRVFNYKYPYEYISGFEEILARKREIEAFYTSFLL